MIVLNENTLENTRRLIGGDDKLVAFLPNRSLIQEANNVKFVWIGNETLTMPKEPLIFKRENTED